MPRVILVTGASRGIGSAIAKEFLENNDIVYLNYKTHDEEARKFLKKYPLARLLKGDISDEATVKNMIAKIKAEVKKIDVVINNAGISIDTTIEDKTKENFTQILNTNLIGPFLVTKYASKIMTKGSIINISSTNGIDTYYPYSMDYDASKAGLISLTHNFAVLLSPNIRVNAIAPGWINTSMNNNLDPKFKENEEKKILLKRFGEPKEIAKTVFFLASPDASYINNTIIRVDGGYYG